MAKDLETFGLNSSTNALKWAAKVLKVRFEEIIVLRKKALDPQDIEGVHEMRVAIRRLRSALRDFSPLLKSRLLKNSENKLKKISAILGQARDDDVAVTDLEKLHEKTQNANIQKNLEGKIEKRQIERKKTQKKLTVSLDSDSLKSLRKKFAKAIDKGVKENKKTVKFTAEEMGIRIISKELHEFCNLSGSLNEPFDQEKLHQFRIAAKRLRYAIQLFTTFRSEELQPFAKEIIRLQDYLGKLHDSDIWIENLNKQLSEKNGEDQIANFWLLLKFTKKRTQNYLAALHLWRKWEKDKFVKKLQIALRANA